MKLVLVFPLYFLLSGLINLNAQNFIQFDTHAIQTGYTHKTQKIENVQPGMSGDQCFWDFSNLVCGEFSHTSILDAAVSPDFSLMEKANLILVKDDDQSFYNLRENQLEYLGYTSKDAIIHFDTAIIRMKYPFNFGDRFNGSFSGTGIHYGTVHTTVNGTYFIEADGIGSLLLPFNVNINNALRVKSVEHFIEYGCNTIEWTITKYLWYSQNYRYPVFSIIHTDIKDGINDTITYNAYYNEEALTLSAAVQDDYINGIKLNIYPNPAKDKMEIKYFLSDLQDVTVALYNLLGSKKIEIVKNQKQKGEISVEINASASNIAPGVYLIYFQIGKNTISKKIIFEDR